MMTFLSWFLGQQPVSKADQLIYLSVLGHVQILSMDVVDFLVDSQNSTAMFSEVLPSQNSVSENVVPVICLLTIRAVCIERERAWLILSISYLAILGNLQIIKVTVSSKVLCYTYNRYCLLAYFSKFLLWPVCHISVPGWSVQIHVDSLQCALFIGWKLSFMLRSHSYFSDVTCFSESYNVFLFIIFVVVIVVLQLTVIVKLK